jgi:hypothetical protein
VPEIGDIVISVARRRKKKKKPFRGGMRIGSALGAVKEFRAEQRKLTPNTIFERDEDESKTFRRGTRERVNDVKRKRRRR